MAYFYTFGGVYVLTYFCLIGLLYTSEYQIDRMGQTDAILEEEVRYRYNSVILHYRKSFIQDNTQR